MRTSFLVPALFAFVLGCQSSSGGTTPEDTTPEPAAGPPGCSRDVIEKDLGSAGMAGPNVNPETGELVNLPPSFVVSTTYLTMKEGEEVQKTFFEMLAPIQESLATQPGLLAVELASSQGCGTARTLTVWKDENAMYAFSTGEAHRQAADRVDEVSRGASMVLHWSAAKAEEATWDFAAKKLGEEEGPLY
jgi:heme-degrading monooxygenase HmoA